MFCFYLQILLLKCKTVLHLWSYVWLQEWEEESKELNLASPVHNIWKSLLQSSTLLWYFLSVIWSTLPIQCPECCPCASICEQAVMFEALVITCLTCAHPSFSLLHASSGCPPLSPCADSLLTPARKQRRTTNETLTCTHAVCGAAGGCESFSCVSSLERRCGGANGLCVWFA